MNQQLRAYESRNSGPRWNSIVDVMVKRFWERVDFFEELLTAGGYPPFTTPLTPMQQYQRLIAWRDAGDDRYWNDKQAQAALDELATRFGPPPLLLPTLPEQTPPPMGSFQ